MNANAPTPHSRGKSARKFRNFLLMPKIQIRLSAYMIFLALFLLFTLSAIIYIKMGEILSLVVQLTDVEEEIKEVLTSYVNDMSLWLILTICIYIACNLAISVLLTHKMIGPTYAFRRHIQALSQARYDAYTHLRKGDAFEELAEDLNTLSNVLAQRQGCHLEHANSCPSEPDEPTSCCQHDH